MKGTKFALQKWSIVVWSALVIGIIISAIWLFYGIDEQGMRIAIRATARTSCILFLSAFVASAIGRIWSSRHTVWLLKNRRYLGISMAVSHSYHAIALAGLWFVTSGTSPKFDPLAMLGYIFLIAMTVTSFHRPALVRSTRLEDFAHCWNALFLVGFYFRI